MLRPRTWWFGAMMGVLILIVFAFAGMLSPVRRVVLAVTVPPARFISQFGSGMRTLFHLDPSAKQAGDRIEELEARLRSLTVDYVQLRALEEENRSLRAQSSFIANRNLKTLGARIIARSMTDQTAVVTIDRGTADGVEVGQGVIAENGLYIGKVISLSERISEVMLLTDVRSRVAASVPGVGRASGIIEGRGSGVAHFTLIPQSLPLSKDDVVVTAGSEEKIPGNLVIGLVNDVESKPTDPFKNAVVEPLAPLGDLDLVSVIITSL